VELNPPRIMYAAADSDTWSVDRTATDEPPNYPPPPVPQDSVINRDEVDRPAETRRNTLTARYALQFHLERSDVLIHLNLVALVRNVKIIAKLLYTRRNYALSKSIERFSDFIRPGSLS
jgi:hypothetical protein